MHFGPQRTIVFSRFDGFGFGAWRFAPQDARRGGLVVAHEIFGLSPHIRDMCEAFAQTGYEVLAPSLFDRIEPGFLVHEDEAGIARGREAVASSPWSQVTGDMQAAIDDLAPRGPVCALGFCYGGAVAWAAAGACEGLIAASAFYGRLIVDLLDRAPKCPILLHYGKRDPLIPLQDVERVHAAFPEIPIRLYEAGHGFCSQRGEDHDPEAKRAALAFTMQFFHHALLPRGGEF